MVNRNIVGCMFVKAWGFLRFLHLSVSSVSNGFGHGRIKNSLTCSTEIGNNLYKAKKKWQNWHAPALLKGAVLRSHNLQLLETQRQASFSLTKFSSSKNFVPKQHFYQITLRAHRVHVSFLKPEKFFLLDFRQKGPFKIPSLLPGNLFVWTHYSPSKRL